MRSELDLSGVYIPGLLCAAGAAFLLNTLLRRGLTWAGVYRFVWHRPLFDLGLYVLLLGLVVWVGNEAGWR
ncbi:MAG TPA: DUF1656 domain-containing protein [Rhodopila sp.]|nr:DUF1656 domain-containing protein [Rhodopila sp.]